MKISEEEAQAQIALGTIKRGDLLDIIFSNGYSRQIRNAATLLYNAKFRCGI